MTSGVVPQMRLRKTPATGLLEWVRDFAGENEVTLLGDLALATVLVPAGITAALVDDLFRRDQCLHHVIVQHPDKPVLVDRSWFEAAITGRLGYGRLLHGRKPILAMVTEDTIVLAHDCTVEAAAAAVISRRTPGRATSSVVVAWPEGELAVAHVSTIFERLAQQYAHQSWHDPLTRLPNRRYLMEQIRIDAQSRAEGDENWHAVLYHLDLDGFKGVNDQFGHAAGDQVLAQFARRLRAVSRMDDLVVRLGGDEFAILTAAPLTVGQRDTFATRLVLEGAGPFVVEVRDDLGAVAEQAVTIGVSVGVAHRDGAQPGTPAPSMGVLLTQADNAMYRAKVCGRGRAEHCSPGTPTGRDATWTTQARRRTA